ncbi:hypothetical protein WA026_009190 [Henosepilachna vigintioctopunctata]|uniref:Uncharacterized protein n=1 Tax=Henosepilachna vigintioctopunctata TaxID=420089 RepID=A0AAW1UZF9_9CUCU
MPKCFSSKVTSFPGDFIRDRREKPTVRQSNQPVSTLTHLITSHSFQTGRPIFTLTFFSFFGRSRRLNEQKSVK